MDERRRTVRGDGLDLAVWEQGDGSQPTVVLVHGYPDTHQMWQGVVERLAVDHHVVTYDVRGAGESARPDGRAGYDLEHLVADLGAVVDAVSPDSPVHLVGHDWGSIQCWEAVTGGGLDGRVASFTSMSGPGLDQVGRWLRDRRTTDWSLLRQGLRSSYTAFFQVPGVPELWWRTVAPRAFRWYLHRLEGVPDRAGPPATLARDGADGLGLYRQNLRRPMADPRPRSTDVPVLLVVIAGDRFVTPALVEASGRYATDLRRVEVDGGHWLPRSRPDVVADLVREHVERVGAGPAR